MAQASMESETHSGNSHAIRTSLVAVSFGLLVLHNIDEAFIHPEHGGKLNLAGNIVLGVLTVVAYARLNRRWRIGITAVFGVLATLQALSGHVVHILSGGAQALDYSGLLYLVGGLVLVGITVADLRFSGEHRTDAPPTTPDPASEQ